MISCDTNILFAYCDRESKSHRAARTFIDSFANRQDFCLAEQVLLELYGLLRNPALVTKPLSGKQAVHLIQAFRKNSAWRIVDVVPVDKIMSQVWKDAAQPQFAYRKIFDARLARTLQHHGVTEFATRNIRDFKTFGFERVWDPTV